MKRIFSYLILLLASPLTTKAQYFGGQGRGDIMATITGVYLPIELLNFNAKGEANKVRIYWSTASETNNDFFTIEKSINGIDWKILGTVKGAGTSTQKLNYQSYDYNPVTGIQYYRLKQTDFDGKYTYSNIAAVDFNENLSFSLFPNPTRSNSQVYLNINSSVNDGQLILVVVHDAMGKEVLSKINIVGKENGSITAIDPSETLAPGIYFVTATSDNSIYNQKLVIK